MFNLFPKRPAPVAPVAAPVAAPVEGATHKAVDNITGLELMTGDYESCVAYVRAFGICHVATL